MKKTMLLITTLLACMMCVSSVNAATDNEIALAIDSGMAWLARAQHLDGSWGDWSQVGQTGMAVKKFEHFAIEREICPLDPAYEYHDQVRRGLNYIFSQAQIIPIFLQPAGDPDSDGDGIGVFFTADDWHRTYESGIALMAIAECDMRDSVVNVPGSPVNGWTYYAVAVDVMDYLAFGQNDAGTPRGGWGYTDNNVNWSDNSNTGYAALGLAYARSPAPHGFGLTIPRFVLAELDVWVNYIQCGDGSPDDGGSGYDWPCSWVNTLKTGNLLFEIALLGETSSPRIDRAIDYLILHWTDPNPDPGWQNHYQAMYAIMKGMEFQGIETFDGIDWYADFADHIVATQNADGSWGPDYWADEVMGTAWALLTLEKAAPPPLATSVPFDIKPQSCPNPLNVKTGDGGGLTMSTASSPIPTPSVLPVAILGTDEFDVTSIDPATVLLMGVPPIRWHYEDVATPVVEDPDQECECTTDGPDGYVDMTLTFSKAAIIGAIGAVEDGDEVPLTITGFLLDSTEFSGGDCVLIRKKGGGGGGGSSESHFTISYPNPFNASTTIRYTLAEPGQVNLTICNVLGQEVVTLANGEYPAGEHSVTWDGRDRTGKAVSSGMYFYSLRTASGVQTRSMTLLK